MTIPFYEEIDKRYKEFNLVNQNDEELKRLGLEPLNIRLRPLYINLQGNIFYGGRDHYNCKLSNDIKFLLNIMNSTEYERIRKGINLDDAHSANYYIHNGNIYFPELIALFAYENIPFVQKWLKEKYQVNSDYYRPTIDEISCEYYKNMIGEEQFYRNTTFVNINLTPKEYLQYRIEHIAREELKQVKDISELNGGYVKWKLNYNSNLYMENKIFWNKAGIYNNECMDLINSFQEAKTDIYESLYRIAMKSSNMQEMVLNLLKSTSCYNELYKLTKEELYGNSWDIKNRWMRMFLLAYRDILVNLIGFDKIETSIPRTISTTKININETFFNYLIMDYNIVQLPKLIYNPEHNDFRWVKPNPYFQTQTEEEYEDEIKLIKKYIPLDERTQYFK